MPVCENYDHPTVLVDLSPFPGRLAPYKLLLKSHGSPQETTTRRAPVARTFRVNVTI
jgi:hypothetical protein